MTRLQRTRILLLIPHLGGGGAEHVIETLARFLSPEKYEVHLALITTWQHNSICLPHFISVHKLCATRVRKGAPGLLRLIWKIRPAVILSGIAHLSLLVLILRPFLPRKTRILVRQNGALSATLASHSHFSASRLAYAAAYRRAHGVICQTEPMAREIHLELGVPLDKLLVLANPIDIQRIRRSNLRTQGSHLPSFLAIGRLVPEKGFDLLLKAFADLLEPFCSSRLTILGDGPEKIALQQLAKALGIHERVHFGKYVSDPAVYFSQASCFVLSSRTEGLPNAVLEAAAAGLPIVATPASAGLSELLRNREGIWLTGEISARALRIALENALTALQPRQRFSHCWIEPYDLSRAIPAYEAAIDDVLARSVP